MSIVLALPILFRLHLRVKKMTTLIGSRMSLFWDLCCHTSMFSLWCQASVTSLAPQTKHASVAAWVPKQTNVGTVLSPANIDFIEIN